MARERRRCPRCDSPEVVRVVYGLPAPEAIERADRGEIHLGGCCITGEDPEWYCKSCKFYWPFPNPFDEDEIEDEEG